ncbi:radical SAM protein [Sodalis ligni]|uniref:radical SAM protein n=1 Tax=Sodalis ligni TaxID=2697027 RepID=UPI00209683CC|nr:radical SAM protein [Sodalis ligni]
MSVKFANAEAFYQPHYKLLPFRFSKLDAKRYFISTDYGEWICLTDEQLSVLVSKKEITDKKLYYELRSKHIIIDDDALDPIPLLASKYKTKKAFLENFAQLHIFVLTVRCNNSCVYCQASRKSCQSDSARFDMSEAVLDGSIDMALSMPSSKLTLEFQGGESTLTMPLVRRAVKLVQQKSTGKEIQFVLCTNLCEVNDGDLNFLIEHNISISTSLDGPQSLHNANRKFSQAGAWEALIATLDRIRQKNAFGNVSALMTTTRPSLGLHKEIIDEYIRHGFSSIFIRELNPYGFAQKYFSKIGYTTEAFWLSMKNAWTISYS